MHIVLGLQESDSPSITPVTIHVYDPLNRLTGADYSTGESFEYQYDAVGNRTAYTATIESTTVTTYTYDAANRLTKVGDVTYTWDDHGNLTNDGVFTHTYNSAGRLVRAESVTVTLVYTYTSAGLRVAQSVDGDVTSFAWDWASGLPEMLSEGGNLYLVGYDTLGQFAGDEWTYYLSDALGSLRQSTDAAGTVLDAREWTPFGVEVGTAQTGLGYTGEWWDASVGLQYLRARWYDGLVGRFTRRDEWEGDYERPLTLNGWSYVEGNPISRIDPTGHFWYDPINGRWANADEPRLEAPFHPKITFYPNTSSFLGPRDVFDWIRPRDQKIETIADQNGIPPELVAGILAVEIDDDTDWKDLVLDAQARACIEILLELGERSPGTLGEMWEASSLNCVCSGVLGAYTDMGLPIGYGVAQIHINREGLDWWAVVQHYQDQGYAVPSWASDPVVAFLDDLGAITGSAMFGRALADVRKGVNQRHEREDLSLDDMAMIFVGYRFGVGGFTDVLGVSYAFPDIPSFQKASRSILPVEPINAQRDFDIARPYFDAFQFYFEYRDLYEAEYGNQW